MERETAEIVVKIYAILSWIGAAGALIGTFIIFAFGAAGVPGLMMGGSSDVFGAGIVGGLAIVLGLFLLAMGVFNAIVGYGLWTRKQWARIAALVLSVISLASFPFGTIIGAVGIWLFGFEETVKSLFTGVADKKKQ